MNMAELSLDGFKEEILRKIKDFLPEEFKDSELILNKVQKNNQELNGLTIKRVDETVTPQIYIDGYYDDYLHGREMDDILQAISDVRVEHNYSVPFDTASILDYEKAKSHIIPRFMSGNDNDKYLNGKPYTMIEDIAVTYHISLENSPEGSMSAPITDAIIDQWGITKEELHDVAVGNIHEQIKPTFTSMRDVMKEMMRSPEMDDEMLEAMLPPDNSMFVLSNEAKSFGAVALLDDAFMDKIAEEVGENFHIIPSSVHELLIIPDSPQFTIEQLKDMVQEVNDTQVAPQDRLSYSVFDYDVSSHSLSVADDVDMDPDFDEDIEEDFEVKRSSMKR